MRVNERAELVELLSAMPAFAPGETWSLSDFPATLHLIETGRPGQVVAGDTAGDPAELAGARATWAWARC